MKAYTSGFINSTYTDNQLIPAVWYAQRLALTASKPVWIMIMVLVAIEICALLLEIAFSDTNRVPFDLDNVSKALKAE
jgi:hypothetical protein